jgi:hypothetical protein
MGRHERAGSAPTSTRAKPAQAKCEKALSRGLGQAQRAALAALDGAPGLTVRELAALLDSTDRRTRKVVTALDARRLVVVRTVDGKRRVWLPGQLPQWERDEMRRKAHGAMVREMAYRLDKDGTCPACGQALPKRRRPV